MLRKATLILLILALTTVALSQNKPQKPDEDQAIRISTDLVQLDAVVTDKNGRIVKDLTRADFELYENSKKQPISFFEFVHAGKSLRKGERASEITEPPPQGPSSADISRIFAFVVDDLTIRNEDLTYVREMLRNFVERQMQPTDLVAIIRTVGGKGLLQQFTADKQLLLKAISMLSLRTHPYNVYNPQDNLGKTNRPPSAASADTGDAADIEPVPNFFEETAVDDTFISSPYDDTNLMLRAYMSLGTARFVIEQHASVARSQIPCADLRGIANTQLAGGHGNGKHIEPDQRADG